MQEQTTNIIEIILLLLGSILMLVTGLGFISSKYFVVAGIAYFILAALHINGILKKQFHNIL
jgi:hypothetical protein